MVILKRHSHSRPVQYKNSVTILRKCLGGIILSLFQPAKSRAFHSEHNKPAQAYKMKYLILANVVFFLSLRVSRAIRTERLFGKAENANERAL